MFSNLNNFNNSYTYAVSDNIASKKWWQYIGQIAAVASGDAMGAAGGAWAAGGLAVVEGVAMVIGGAGGSYMAYFSSGGSCRGVFNQTNSQGSSVIYDFPSDFDHLENLGLLHNSALQNIYLSSNPVPELTWLQNNIPNINIIDYNKLYTSIEFQTFKGNIVSISSNYRTNNYNINQMLIDYKNKGLINDNIKSVLSLYFNASMQSKDFNDYKTITDYYVSTI